MTAGTSLWRWTRPVVAVGTLAVVVWYLGIGPFLDGIRAVDGAALVAGAGIGVLRVAVRCIESIHQVMTN